MLVRFPFRHTSEKTQQLCLIVHPPHRQGASNNGSQPFEYGIMAVCTCTLIAEHTWNDNPHHFDNATKVMESGVTLRKFMTLNVMINYRYRGIYKREVLIWASSNWRPEKEIVNHEKIFFMPYIFIFLNCLSLSIFIYVDVLVFSFIHKTGEKNINSQDFLNHFSSFCSLYL